MNVTDEMVEAYHEASWVNPQETHGAEFPNVSEGLAAVLAIIERDYRMKLRRTPSWRDAPGCMCARTGRPYRLCPVHGEVVS